MSNIWTPGQPRTNVKSKDMLSAPETMRCMGLVIQSLMQFLDVLFKEFNTYYAVREKFGKREASGESEVEALNKLVHRFNDIYHQLQEVIKEQQDEA